MKKILIVDDSPDIVLMLNDRLKGLGYETITAEDGNRVGSPSRSLLTESGLDQVKG